MASILSSWRSPLAANDLVARDRSTEAKAARREIDKIGDICHERSIPWCCCPVVLRPKSSGVLDHFYAAGASGFLAGRTIWLDAILKNFRTAVSASLRKEWPERAATAQRADLGQGHAPEGALSGVHGYQAGR